jgi:hypothetical protein
VTRAPFAAALLLCALVVLPAPGCATRRQCWPGLTTEEIAAVRAAQQELVDTRALYPKTPAEYTAARYIGSCGFLDPDTGELRQLRPAK